jgi:cytochrome c biogenesis protein CcdA/thiol-disulfide isomerase/thioredoxin
MAGTFAAVATLAAVGGNLAIQANEFGRAIAITLLALFGASLLSDRVATTIARPFVAIGNRLANDLAASSKPSVLGSLLLGVATGFLWAPCAGPILGLVLTGAALQGANIHTTLLLMSYGAGAATSLALALFVGGSIFARLKMSLGVSERLRQVAGVAVLAGVAVIGLGLDTSLLARLSYTSTNSLEQFVLTNLEPRQQASLSAAPQNGGSTAISKVASKSFASGLPIEGQAPSLSGAVTWLNSPPLSMTELRGKVVLIDFWTYSCINCIRTLPYVRAWAEKYKDEGLVVIGVHSPEFAFEKNIENVKRAVRDFQITYPVAIDNDYKIWRAFHNSYWPAHYLIDAEGRIRYHQFGEGEYVETEDAIRDLLREAGKKIAASAPVDPNATGAEESADLKDLRSDETYIGYQQASNFASEQGVLVNASQVYSVENLKLNEWGLNGDWTVKAQEATLNKSDGGIKYKFDARDLNLVLGASSDHSAIRFKVMIDGKAPGKDHGSDTDADGNGTIDATRLYQLVRQSGSIGPHVFEIQFLEPGVKAYAFTFG